VIPFSGFTIPNLIATFVDEPVQLETGRVSVFLIVALSGIAVEGLEWGVGIESTSRATINDSTDGERLLVL
jgi:hypothetical protein